MNNSYETSRESQSAGSVPDRPKVNLMCRLLWRRDKLWVLPAKTSMPHLSLPALAEPTWAMACLERSKAKAVVIDPSLGAEVAQFWAEACKQVDKSLYLRLPAMKTLPEKQKVIAWRFKCLTERVLGFFLLILFSPLILLFALLLRLESDDPVLTYYWCIGNRGKVFRMLQFRRESRQTGEKTKQGYFLELTRLDRLPRLVNVAQGEMVFVGTKPWVLEDALDLPETYRGCLKSLPGIIGPRFMATHSSGGDVLQILKGDLFYLKAWSWPKDGLTGIKIFLFRNC